MTNIIKYILKWEGGHKRGNPVLFFPESPVNAGRIMSYTHIGQHGEADFEYYRGLPKPLFTSMEVQRQCKALVDEYHAFLHTGEIMQCITKSSPSMRKLREEVDNHHVQHS